MVTGWFAGVVILVLYTLAVLAWMVLVMVPLVLQRWIWGSGWQRKVGWVVVMIVFFYGISYLVYDAAPSYFATVTPIDGQYFSYGGFGALFVGIIVLRWRMAKLGIETDPWDG